MQSCFQQARMQKSMGLRAFSTCTPDFKARSSICTKLRSLCAGVHRAEQLNMMVPTETEYSGAYAPCQADPMSLCARSCTNSTL